MFVHLVIEKKPKYFCCIQIIFSKYLLKEQNQGMNFYNSHPSQIKNSVKFMSKEKKFHFVENEIPL
jgi:hypothetical protein